MSYNYPIKSKLLKTIINNSRENPTRMHYAMKALLKMKKQEHTWINGDKKHLLSNKKKDSYDSISLYKC